MSGKREKRGTEEEKGEAMTERKMTIMNSFSLRELIQSEVGVQFEKRMSEMEKRASSSGTEPCGKKRKVVLDSEDEEGVDEKRRLRAEISNLKEKNDKLKEENTTLSELIKIQTKEKKNAKSKLEKELVGKELVEKELVEKEEKVKELKQEMSELLMNYVSLNDKNKEDVDSKCKEIMDELSEFYMQGLDKDYSNCDFENKDSFKPKDEKHENSSPELPHHLSPNGFTYVVMMHVGSRNKDEYTPANLPKWNFCSQVQNEKIIGAVESLVCKGDSAELPKEGDTEKKYIFTHVGYGRVERTTVDAKTERVDAGADWRKSYKIVSCVNCNLEGRNWKNLEERKKHWFEREKKQNVPTPVRTWYPPSDKTVLNGANLKKLDDSCVKAILAKIEEWKGYLESKPYPVGGSSESDAASDSSLVRSSKLQSRGLVGFSSDGCTPPTQKWWIKPHLLLSFLSKFADCLNSCSGGDATDTWCLTLSFHGINEPHHLYCTHPNVFNTFLSGNNNMRGSGIYLCKTGHVARMYGTRGQIPVLVLCKKKNSESTDLVCDFTRHAMGMRTLDDNCFRVRDPSFILPLGCIQ